MDRVEPEDLGPTVAGMSAIYQSLAPVFGVDPRTGVIDEGHRRTARKILLHSSVWLPRHVYVSWPVLFPWIVRDNAQVAKGRKGYAHRKTGLEIQDNGPIGSVKNGRPVDWQFPGSPFGTKPIATGPHQWMQSHCWDDMVTDPMTNSFVPNLVWLPYGMGRLTDDEGSLFSQEVRRIAWSLYRHLPVPDPLRARIERTWALLDTTVGEPVAAHELQDVNWFVADEPFHVGLREQHLARWHAVSRVIRGEPLTGLKVPKKYRETLPRVPRPALLTLREHLEPFALAAEQFEMPHEASKPNTKAKTKSQGAPTGAMTGSPTPKGSSGFLIATPSGELIETSRSRAAVALVRAVFAAGASAAEMQKVLPAGVLRCTAGRLDGDALWYALEAGGAKGGRKKWFVDDPIYVGDQTWVVNSHAWTEDRQASKFPQLCAISDGKVTYSKMP